MKLLSVFSGASPALIAVMVSTLIMFAVAIGFLIAAALLRRSNNRKARLWATLELNLDAMIGGIVRGSADASVLHRRIQPDQRVVLLDYLYKATIQEPLPERRELYRELARPYLSELERRARIGDVWQRARAIRTLAELAGRVCGPTITKALDAPEPHVALTAARAYAQLGLGTVEPLLARIERYQSWDRRLLRSVLVSFGPEAAPALLERLADRSAEPAVRAVCADALAAMDYRHAGDTAAAVLRYERNIDLIAAALRLLRAPATPAQRATVRSMCTSKDEVIRSQAIACLSRIGAPEDMVVVRHALADPSPWVARSAGHGLAAFSGARGEA